MSNWNFSGVWNEALAAMPERETEARDYIWASELGRGMYDRYHKMHGRTPTTPPNLRARRKFEAGNLTEWVLQQVLSRAGVLQAAQERIYFNDGPMVVSGRCDFIGGGQVKDIDEAFLEGLPESFVNITQVALAHLKEKFPDGLREQGLEIKSCSGMMFDRYEKAPGLHHALQAFHYAHNKRMPFVIEYVSRDDLRMCSWIIMPDAEKWSKLYHDDIQRMSEIYQLPAEDVPLEPLLEWNEADKKFKKNFEVEYSLYLTDYGFEQPEDYRQPAESWSRRLNNVVKKLLADQKITKVNIQTVKDGIKFYPPVKDIFVRLGIAEEDLAEEPAVKDKENA